MISLTSLQPDIDLFLASYPGSSDGSGSDHNLRFYRDEIPMRPGNITVDEFDEKYSEDFETLEEDQ